MIEAFDSIWSQARRVSPPRSAALRAEPAEFVANDASRRLHAELWDRLRAFSLVNRDEPVNLWRLWMTKAALRDGMLLFIACPEQRFENESIEDFTIRAVGQKQADGQSMSAKQCSMSTAP